MLTKEISRLPDKCLVIGTSTLLIEPGFPVKVFEPNNSLLINVNIVNALRVLKLIILHAKAANSI